jgi:3-isopropylmalate/(R)-2-methylmalate dehydratase small subunit
MTSTTGPQRSLTGRAWVFGDNINTDAMYPGFAMRMDIPQAAQHVFYDLRPGWTSEVSQGDIVVAGRNFGLGSSRPVAALMGHLGVAALVAEEFNSLFLRNAINNGLPAVTVPDVRQYVTEGQTITVDLQDSVLIAAEQRLEFAPLPGFVLDILDAGGLLPRLVADGYLPEGAAGARA